MQKITPFLWFDNNAEEAAQFYTSVFKNSRILSVSRYGDAGPGPKGSVMVVSFQLEGQQFTALNGGPFSWQIVPTALGKLMTDKDPKKANRVMQALLQMKKLDLATLEQAAEGSVPASR